MRNTVKRVLALGPIPPEGSPDAVLKRYAEALDRIPRPLTDVEAEALMDCFTQECATALAWQLLHLIETSPTPLPREQPSAQANEWVQRLYQRYQ